MGADRLAPVLCVLGLGAIVTLPLGAVIRSDHFEGWGVDDGLPIGSVANVAQTPDGYLWLTTTDGLVRFDGLRFVVFNKSNTPALATNRFTSLYVDREGTLWAGTEANGLVRYRDGAFSTITTENGLVDNRVRGIRPDPDGHLLVLGEKLSWWDGRRFWAHPTNQYRTPETRPYVSRGGRVWHLDSTGLYPVDAKGRGKRVLASRLVAKSNITILEDRAGALWLAVARGGLYHLDGSEVISYGTREGLPDPHVRDILRTRAGDLWVATDAGVARFENGRFVALEDEQRPIRS